MLIAVAFTLLLTFLLALLLGDRDRGALAATAFVVALALGNVLASAAVALVGLLVVVEGLVNRGIAGSLGGPRRGAVGAGGRAAPRRRPRGRPARLVRLGGRGRPGPACPGADGRRVRPGGLPTSTSSCSTAIPADDAAELDPSFDADAFPDALEERGFDVQRHSRSNYLLTRLTLATMFGNDHVAEEPALARPHGPACGRQPASPPLPRSGSRSMRLLGDDGYEGVCPRSWPTGR